MPRIILVTGSSAGIGRASAIAFGARGDTVVLVARGEKGLAGAAAQVEQAGGTAHVIPADVADPDQVFAVADRVEAEIGPIDVWVNVAFTSVFAPFEQIKPEEYRRVTEVSYLGYVYGTMAALKHMKPRDRGTIVQVGSALAYRGIPLQSAYCGAKHAIQGFNEALRCELLHDRSNVHVTMVQMPAVNTPQFSWVLSRLPHRAQPVPPIYQPEFAARGVLFAADHPKRREYWVGASTMGTLAANAIAPDCWTATSAERVSSPSRPSSAAIPTPRSTCGNRPTARAGATSALTACSTTSPTSMTRSCGPPTTMACSAHPWPAPPPRSSPSSADGGDHRQPAVDPNSGRCALGAGRRAADPAIRAPAPRRRRPRRPLGVDRALPRRPPCSPSRPRGDLPWPTPSASRSPGRPRPCGVDARRSAGMAALPARRTGQRRQRRQLRARRCTAVAGATMMTAAASPSDRVPPQVLREYALLADGERGAVVGPRGDIVWMCAPRWDSDAVFTSLIGGVGEYTVTPAGRSVWGGYYEEGSMIWRSRWVTDEGIIECREALAYPGDPHHAVLLRRIHALDHAAAVTVSLEPRAGYGTHGLDELHRHAGVWVGRTGDLRLRWSGGEVARPRHKRQALHLALDLEAGQHHDLVLELSDRPLPDHPVDAETAWAATEAAWRAAIPALDGVLAQRDTRRSYAVLRGLTSTGGGMVAAATTSLPERAEAGRNYDYRYVWIRDQCYAGQAVAAAGSFSLLDAAVSFVGARLLEHGDRLAPAYTTTGDPVHDQRHLSLAGYPGGYDIVGNWVNRQFQLDAFGEALLLFAAAARHDRLDTQGWRAAEAAATAISRRWTEPDAGIWEIDNRPWTHSRLTAAAGLRAIAAAHPAPAQGTDWLALADHIVADTAAHALHPDGHWQRSPDDPALDAALLLPGLRGAVPADDPRTVATLSAYLRELTRDGYAYRFRHDDRPLQDAEGSFLLCGFLVALSLDQQHQPVEARAWYERTRAACGPPGLFSEEYDPHEHQMRGNLPQAFVHALMIEASARLAP